MQSWQIIIASAVAAMLVDAVLLLAAGWPPGDGARELLTARWPAAVVVWLAVYAGSSALLSLLAIIVESRGAARFDGEPGWMRQYFGRLLVSQYFTAAVVLFAFFLWRMPVGGPVSAGAVPGTLLACDLVLVVGLLGALVVLAATRLPPAAVQQPTSINPELRLLREVRDLLRARENTDGITAAEARQLILAVEQGQRAMQEGLKGLAGAVSRLSRSLREHLQNAKAELQEREPALPADVALIDDSIGQLRAAVAALEASVAELRQTASLLAGRQVPPLPPSAARARTSAELQELMRAMPPESKPEEPPG